MSEGRSSIRNLRTLYAVVTATHVSRVACHFSDLFVVKYHEKWRRNMRIVSRLGHDVTLKRADRIWDPSSSYLIRCGGKAAAALSCSYLPVVRIVRMNTSTPRMRSWCTPGQVYRLLLLRKLKFFPLDEIKGKFFLVVRKVSQCYIGK
jgi:hypothetical protein